MEGSVETRLRGSVGEGGGSVGVEGVAEHASV
jgi:hypothetical protein